MAFINETTTSIADFITKLNTFLTGDGWTSDELNTAGGEWGISKGTVFLQARWDTATPEYLGIYHSLGFISTATLPGNQTDDSGNGAISGTNSTLLTQRFAWLSSAPIQYWAFTGSTNYFHVVVQRDTVPSFVHFGAGLLNKIGDWTGGEYAYGTRQQFSFTTDVAIRTSSSHLMDGLAADADSQSMELFAGTIHLEGFPNQEGGGSAKWGVAMGNQNVADLGVDRASVARDRIQGGFRGGPIAYSFGRYLASPVFGLIPAYPILSWYNDFSGGLSDMYPLGFMPDIRGMNIDNFVGGNTTTIGSETWVLFPSFRKGESGSLLNTTGHQGVAYLKNV